MERVYTIKNSTLRVIFGDITTSKTDVIVSSDDAFLTMGGGVSKAIKMSAGDILCKEVGKHIPASLGDVIVTSAGYLPHKYVFHAITISKEDRVIRWADRPEVPQDVQRYIIRHTVEKCFTLLSSLGLNSIAFPTIGAGTARISYELVAKEMAESLTANLAETANPLSVELYLWDNTKKMTEMDYIIFFEQIAIAIQGMQKQIQNTSKAGEDSFSYNVRNKEEATLIRCFMAGSTSLEQERNAFRAEISKADNFWAKVKYDIKAFDYQDFSSSYQKEGHQVAYNVFIENLTDFMVIVLTGQPGSKTKEELVIAAQSYERSGHPRFYILIQEDAYKKDVWGEGVKEWLDDKRQYVIRYNTLQDFQYRISDCLKWYIIERWGKDE